MLSGVYERTHKLDGQVRRLLSAPQCVNPCQDLQPSYLGTFEPQSQVAEKHEGRLRRHLIFDSMIPYFNHPITSLVQLQYQNTYVVLTPVLQRVLHQLFCHILRTLQTPHQLHRFLVLTNIPQSVTRDYQKLCCVFYHECLHVWNVWYSLPLFYIYFTFEHQVAQCSRNGELSSNSAFENKSSFFFNSGLLVLIRCFVVDRDPFGDPVFAQNCSGIT